MPYTLRPEVAAALNPPQPSVAGYNNGAGEQIPGSAHIRDRSDEGVMNMDDGGEFYDSGQYASVPRDRTLPLPEAPAMANPQGHVTTMNAAITRGAPTLLSASALNADVYPDVSVDDYLSGRFQPPANRVSP